MMLLPRSCTLLVLCWMVVVADSGQVRRPYQAEPVMLMMPSGGNGPCSARARANLRLRGGALGFTSIFSRLVKALRGPDPDTEELPDAVSIGRPKRHRVLHEEQAGSGALKDALRGGAKRRKGRQHTTASRMTDPPAHGDQEGKAKAESQAPAFSLDDTSIESMLKTAPSLQWDGQNLFTIPKGFVKDMNVDASFYANKQLLKLVLTELGESAAQQDDSGRKGGFLPAVRQLANVATLPGVVHSSIGMPDIHSGYGFAIGNVAAVDLDQPDAVVSPGGVGFDINCGVRLLRTELTVKELEGVKDVLADALFNYIPVGVGEGSVLGRKVDSDELDDMLDRGMAWLEDKGLCWPEDRQFVEQGGCFEGADHARVSARAKARGRAQCGSLGSGNHYVEVQEVSEVFDQESAAAMGLREGMVVIMMHSGSRGLGHQVCTDALEAADKAMAAQGISVVDRQLACCRVASEEGQTYLAAMQAAANFAFINRSLMAKAAREAFAKVFGRSAEELGMHTVYDVSHNIAKSEQHSVGNRTCTLLVHRKGATRAFGPGHPELPEKYRSIGQPVLVGGSMGTCSYVLTGTQGAMDRTFGSTCHGAGRAMSRTKAKRTLDAHEVLRSVEAAGCTTRVAKKGLAAEEAPASYKDVSEVVETCHAAGISKKCVQLRPLICIKG